MRTWENRLDRIRLGVILSWEIKRLEEGKMLHVYQINPEKMTYSEMLSEADCRGVGDWEIVSPRELNLEEIIEYCNNNWAVPPEETGYENYDSMSRSDPLEAGRQAGRRKDKMEKVVNKTYRVWFADGSAILVDAASPVEAKQKAIILADPRSKVARIEQL